VLGELPAPRRAEFEARMAASRELSALVRELEEGAVALSTASPRRRPPPQVWTSIDKVLRRDNRGTMLSAFKLNWWRNGWAAALASVLGWVLYAVFMNFHHVSPTTPPRETSAGAAAPVIENVISKPSLPSASNASVQLLRASAEEVSDLRLKVVQLEKETGQLSQLVVQQRALLAETNRIKFYHFSPISNAGSEAVTAPLSPELQRAVFISIGRQLGWLPAEAKPRESMAAGDRATVNTIGGVDFVDLRPAKNEVVNQPPTQQTPAPTTPAPQMPTQPETEAQLNAATDPTIPAFVVGDKLVVALDPAMVPANSTVAFSVHGLSAGTADGSFVMGNNPAVVTMPYFSGTIYEGGLYLTIGTTTPWGQSNTTQFFAPANP